MTIKERFMIGSCELFGEVGALKKYIYLLVCVGRICGEESGVSTCNSRHSTEIH